jgi:hypothetical protein
LADRSDQARNDAQRARWPDESIVERTEASSPRKMPLFLSLIVGRGQLGRLVFSNSQTFCRMRYWVLHLHRGAPATNHTPRKSQLAPPSTGSMFDGLLFSCSGAAEATPQAQNSRVCNLPLSPVTSPSAPSAFFELQRRCAVEGQRHQAPLGRIGKGVHRKRGASLLSAKLREC